MPPLQPLTRLSQLHELELVEDATFQYGGLQLLPITAFPAMQRLTLCSSAHLKVRRLGCTDLHAARHTGRVWHS